MIDWTRIKELRRDIGEDDFDEVMDIFIDEVDGIIDRLRHATADDQIGAHLHCLKGSAANLGFSVFAQACAAAEAAADRSGHAAVDVPAILRIYEESRAAFLDDIAVRLA